jgi:hypothetical protein
MRKLQEQAGVKGLGPYPGVLVLVLGVYVLCMCWHATPGRTGALVKPQHVVETWSATFWRHNILVG